MITLHHLDNSRSQRIAWLLEELGLPYTLVTYARDARTMLAPASLRAVHPLGKAPVLTDGDLTLAESGAIIEYLADRYDTDLALIPPPGSRERLRCNYWLHYAEGSAMPPLLLALVFAKVAAAPAPFFVRPVAKAIAAKVHKVFIGPQLKLHREYLESQLDGHDWFAGDHFSVADIALSFPIEAMAARGGLTPAAQPRLIDFLQRIHARSAYQRALERGGPYALG